MAGLTVGFGRETVDARIRARGRGRAKLRVRVRVRFRVRTRVRVRSRVRGMICIKHRNTVHYGAVYRGLGPELGCALPTWAAIQVGVTLRVALALGLVVTSGAALRVTSGAALKLNISYP